MRDYIKGQSLKKGADVMAEKNLNKEAVFQENQDAGEVLAGAGEGDSIKETVKGFQEIPKDLSEVVWQETEDGEQDFGEIMEGSEESEEGSEEIMKEAQEVLASPEEIAEITGEVLASSEEMLEFFQKGWEDSLEALVEKVARKAGYLDNMAGGHKEYLENTLLLQRERLRKKIGKMDHKVSLRPRETPFVEDIKAYFRYTVQTLMNEGKSEDEAFRVVWSRVERAAVKEPDFDSFVLVFDGFWAQEYLMWDNMRVHHGELIGLFYSGFLLLGITVGSFLGYLLGHGIGETVLGCVVGISLGLSCGIFTHALLRGRAHARDAARRRRS
ncbi:MAG: hypothetical protein FWG14_04345 [Peptococcaceae bacterium]|nr:hypothetical protein [Peptococcaceae bacterium]